MAWARRYLARLFGLWFGASQGPRWRPRRGRSSACDGGPPLSPPRGRRSIVFAAAAGCSQPTSTSATRPWLSAARIPRASMPMRARRDVVATNLASATPISPRPWRPACARKAQSWSSASAFTFSDTPVRRILGPTGRHASRRDDGNRGLASLALILGAALVLGWALFAATRLLVRNTERGLRLFDDERASPLYCEDWTMEDCLPAALDHGAIGSHQRTSEALCAVAAAAGRWPDRWLVDGEDPACSSL